MAADAAEVDVCLTVPVTGIEPCTPDPAVDAAMAAALSAGGVVVLSGAGISTGSGIPDYRGPTGRRRTTAPMQWATFAGDAEARRRYWARGQVGFRRYDAVVPNPAHRAVAAAERAALVTHVVTQNVDGLHQAAGSVAVTELHGSLAEVVCMGCGHREPRPSLAARLDDRNPWIADVAATQLADGDAVLADEHVRRFEVVGCRSCGGDVRPDVVFFGEFVPRDRMRRAKTAVEQARTVLVAGSSLAVGSGWLLLRHAVRHGARVLLATAGTTRGDDLADVRSHEDLVRLLPRVVRRTGVHVPA